MNGNFQWQLALGVAQALGIDDRKRPLKRWRRYAMGSISEHALCVALRSNKAQLEEQARGHAARQAMREAAL